LTKSLIGLTVSLKTSWRLRASRQERCNWRREWSSLSEVITTAMQTRSAAVKDYRLELWLDDELPSVRVDERAVAEVIYVLVDNAAKYSLLEPQFESAAEAQDTGMVRLNS